MGPSRADKRADPLRYLPPAGVHTLASILCYPSSNGATQPTKEWLAQQKHRIYDMPRALKLHRSVSLATFFSIDEVVSGRLCSYHAELKPELIFWCYAQLNEEVCTHIDRFRRYRMRFPDECTDELRDYIDRVTSIATLYMRRDDFEAEYGRHALEEDERYPRVRGGCAACVLSVIGARAQMLIDLRASMLARRKGKTPRLLCLVEAWMDEFPSGTLDMRIESEEIAQELGAFRDRIREVRGMRGDERGERREKQHYDERDKRRRRKHHERASVSRAIADFFGWKFGDKKKRHGGSSGSHHQRSSSRRASSPPRESSSRHGSSTHRDTASRAGSTYSSHSSSARPEPSASHRPQSEYVERHSSRPDSSATRIQAWDDSLATQAGYDDNNPCDSFYVAPYTEEVPDDATLRGSRYRPPSDGDSEASSTSRYSRDPYRQSFPANRRPESTASQNTIRPQPTASGNTPLPPRGSHLQPPAPSSDRYSWTSSVYSTDDNGLRARDAGFRATGNGCAVRKPLAAVIEGLELEEDDVPLEPGGYDEVCCPSSDSEDGNAEGEDEEVEQYVGARAGWGKQAAHHQGSGGSVDGSSSRADGPSCPVCQGDLAALAPEQANAHCNACIDGKAAPLSARHGRPTVSGIGRMVDEVIDGFGNLSTIDEAAAQFTPRPSVASRVRREYHGQPPHRGSGYAPSSVGVGVSDDEVRPDDSRSVAGVAPGRPVGEAGGRGSVAGSSATRRSALGGGKFRNVVRDR